jgi:hypothetical protein
MENLFTFILIGRIYAGLCGKKLKNGREKMDKNIDQTSHDNYLPAHHTLPSQDTNTLEDRKEITFKTHTHTDPAVFPHHIP